MKRFDGKVALITGAARGIGAGVARGYVARGGKVALLGLEPDLLKSLSEELGDAAMYWEADVRDGRATTEAIDAAAAHFGRIDHVLANAGIASYGTVRQIDEAAFDRVIDININGVFRTLQASHPTPGARRRVTRSWSRPSPRSRHSPGWRRTTRARPEPSRSPSPTARRSPTSASASASATRRGSTPTSSVTPRRTCPTFRAIRKKLPYPANSTTSIEKCVEQILAGFAKRKARVYIPKGVVLANFTKPLVNSIAAWPRSDAWPRRWCQRWSARSRRSDASSTSTSRSPTPSPRATAERRARSGLLNAGGE